MEISKRKYEALKESRDNWKEKAMDRLKLSNERKTEIEKLNKQIEYFRESHSSDGRCIQIQRRKIKKLKRENKRLKELNKILERENKRLKEQLEE